MLPHGANPLGPRARLHAAVPRPPRHVALGGQTAAGACVAVRPREPTLTVPPVPSRRTDAQRAPDAEPRRAPYGAPCPCPRVSGAPLTRGDHALVPRRT